ncbi:hypothetical protein [Roseateles albus]|uniref:Uncharacterized protein n=1 Tax=Roseateles albus TaxID=2987525 RepID=A0ABT5KCU5_9BURK|nr:hypothetical protein [Roseateles albus]MDC8771740.1 hypothetical protein [Roseateles albus]
MGAVQDYIDLLASGDKQKINCVLMGAGVGALGGGVAAGLAFAPANAVPVAGQAFNATAAGIGAVLGALSAAKMAYGACGGSSTKGDFDRTLDQGKIETSMLNSYESELIKSFSLSAGDARVLAKAAAVYSYQNPSTSLPDASSAEKKNAVVFLLNKLAAEYVTA